VLRVEEEATVGCRAERGSTLADGGTRGGSYERPLDEAISHTSEIRRLQLPANHLLGEPSKEGDGGLRPPIEGVNEHDGSVRSASSPLAARSAIDPPAR
jgi:hypothetical protein